MKRAKTKRVIPPLAPNASDEEIVKWLTKYDLDERLAAGVSEIVEIHEPSKQENQSTRLTPRFSRSMKSTPRRAKLRASS
jgi:hypothetical protein